MNPKILVVALSAALSWGCASTDKNRLAYQVVPVSAVSHGVSGSQSYYQLARYYQGQKRYDLAEAAYRKSLDIDGSQVAARNALGSLHAERGDLAAAVKQFEQALAIVPDAGYLYNNLGFAYYLQGRLGEAYDAIRKALAHDPTLDRGWANLARIADAQSDPRLAAVAKSRQVQTLPATLLAEPAPVETPALAFAEARTEGARSDNGKFVLVSTGREVVNLVEPTRETRHEPVVVVANPPARERPLPPLQGEGRGGDGVQMSAKPTELPLPTLGPAAKSETDIDFAHIRIEVANANGIGGFAKKFSAQLRHERIPVRRITNHSTFMLKATVIEYQPGSEKAAKALMQRMEIDAQLIPAPAARVNSDVRIVLGRDALSAGRPLLAKAQ